MLARYVQKGDSIDYRPTNAVAAGSVIVIADLVGIARLDIEANTLGSLAVVGVFDVVKAAGQIPSGSTVYWDAEAQKATLVSGSNHYLGKAIAESANGDETVRVLLNAPYSLASTFVAGDPITDLIDNSGGVAVQTIAEITECECKDAIASLTKKNNEILTALRAVGIIATE
jgi:predicted RecA/RadA family phage recombinase